ncbi:alpha-(1,6)-fucosyltransferase isoform X2 [Plutella xylostella]|uniref:alpha-(1,6)-fucosyltransferase isoform X1 n=1 Tax=Plutella xylostella TaxID=51655 RepID=UPI0005D05258|nr:alpha-(1,6)-fucosyltransferase isoform X1 [Plutella xylostella]XP_048483247.1 alpha-(1,6)-fucosyltransferase isoform X2 [Plutella xylostella]
MSFHEYAIMYVSSWKRVVVILFVIWAGTVYLMLSPSRCGLNEDLDIVELTSLKSQLEELRQNNLRLLAQFKQSGLLSNLDPGSLPFDSGQGPPVEYEHLRRRIYSNMKELWYYLQHELGAAAAGDAGGERLRDILDEAEERKRSLLSDMEKLPSLDGYQEWREAEAANASDLVQRRLRYLQNPADCANARKLVCNLNKGCGFGCQMHHLVYCLIFAYATERTLIVNSKGWRYNTKGWDYTFYPLSETCTTTFDDKVHPWPAQSEAKVISLPYIDSISRKPQFLPLTVPKDLAARVLKFNGDPAAWWIGQVLKFILRPRPEMQRAINETIAKMNFQRPIVGIHIRRTDKVGAEAAFHHIHEYMKHVKQYYDKLQLSTDVRARRVYIATDDPNALSDARSKYPDYTFHGDPSIAKTAAHRRYTPLSLTGLLVDLQLLSSCDYIVCTFSSQIGRLAYEMMQANRADASNSYFTLDDIYYYGGQNAHNRIAVLPHKGGKHEDISFEVGDFIGVAGNHWNGYGRGTNKKTNQDGLIPWYKTADHLVMYAFPEYKQVPLYKGQKIDPDT